MWRSVWKAGFGTNAVWFWLDWPIISSRGSLWVSFLTENYFDIYTLKINVLSFFPQEILEVDIEDEKQLDDSPENF